MRLAENKVTSKFDYNRAFSRNLGWFNEIEQEKIRTAVIAIPGMGGVGGHHLHSLLRVGFSRFKIADFDYFDVHNFNRQIGANVNTVGMDKCEVMRDLALSINPESQVEIFQSGVTKENAQDFLKGVDIVIDSLDIYQIDMRIVLYDLAHDKKIPVLTAAPLGMGTSILCFNPDKLSFTNYFNINENLSDEDKLARMLAGVAPKALHLKYLYYKKFIKFSEGQVPSLHMGCLAATSALSSACTKIILNRGSMIYAPSGYQVDFYRNKMKKFWRPFGNKNPIQKLIILYIKFSMRRTDRKK